MNIPVIIRSKKPTPQRLIIDMILKFGTDSYHISRITYGSNGFYDVARTYESPDCPIDVHTSYHPSGEMHGKMTRGKLLVYPEGRVLGEAKPRTEAKEVILWQRKGQPWRSLKGVEKVALHPRGVRSFTNINALATGYPMFVLTDADYIFEIGDEFLSSNFGIEYFLMEPSNVTALEAALTDGISGWHISGESTVIERADLFTDLNPWVAIVLFGKRQNT